MGRRIATVASVVCVQINLAFGARYGMNASAADQVKPDVEHLSQIGGRRMLQLGVSLSGLRVLRAGGLSHSGDAARGDESGPNLPTADPRQIADRPLSGL